MTNICSLFHLQNPTNHGYRTSPPANCKRGFYYLIDERNLCDCYYCDPKGDEEA